MRKINCTGCPVTDASLELLHDLKSLKELDATGSRVTPEGAARLRKAIPGIRVSP